MTLRDLVPWGRDRKFVPARSIDHPVDVFHREIDSFFEDFGSVFGRMSRLTEPLRDFTPTVDVSESDTEFRISAELPGMDEKDIDVKIADGTLVLRGEKRQESERRDASHHAIERSYGAFERHFSIPVEIDEEKVGARFKNGVLIVTLPKKEPGKSIVKKIPVVSS